MSVNRDSNGNPVYMQIRREPDGTWSRNVWSGSGNVTNVRRYYGYATRRAARNGNISMHPGETR